MGTSAEDQEAAEQAKKAEREAEAAEHQSRRTQSKLPTVGTPYNRDQ